MWTLPYRGHSHVQYMQYVADSRGVNLLMINIVSVVLTCCQIRDAAAHGLQISELVCSSITLGIRFTATAAVVRGAHKCYYSRSKLIMFVRVVNMRWQLCGVCFLSTRDAGHQSRKRSAVTGATTVFLIEFEQLNTCLLYTSPSPRDGLLSRMPSSA